MREQITALILETKVIAIVRGLDDGFVPLAHALYDGGIRAMEVTFNQKDPESYAHTAKAIGSIREAMGDRMAVGAGTVTSTELVRRAAEAGAQFIVSPDVNEGVISLSRKLGMVSIPGALTPSEILRAYQAGADFVKVFPAGNLGAGYIRAIRGPLNHIRLLAVGGVGEANAREFMAAGCVGIGAGGNLVNRQWIETGEFGRIEELARKLCQSVNG